MGKGTYLGGSTIGYGDVAKNTGRASRFSSKMMKAYNLRTMTAAERKNDRKNKAIKKKAALAANKKITVTKKHIQFLPMLKPGEIVTAGELKGLLGKSKKLRSFSKSG